MVPGLRRQHVDIGTLSNQYFCKGRNCCGSLTFIYPALVAFRAAKSGFKKVSINFQASDGKTTYYPSDVTFLSTSSTPRWRLHFEPDQIAFRMMALANRPCVLLWVGTCFTAILSATCCFAIAARMFTLVSLCHKRSSGSDVPSESHRFIKWLFSLKSQVPVAPDISVMAEFPRRVIQRTACKKQEPSP